MWWELEGLAEAALERSDQGIPVDPDIVAHRLGLTVRTAPGCPGLLLGTTIVVDDAMRAERRAFAIAHELGHYLLRREGLADSERAANYTASALLLPRRDFEADLRRCGWDLLRLRARHRHASFEALARRIVALREARAFIVDRPLRADARRRCYSVPGGSRPSAVERDAIEAALATGAPAEPYPGVTAWPVLEHHWHRVVTVAAVDSLSCASPKDSY